MNNNFDAVLAFADTFETMVNLLSKTCKVCCNFYRSSVKKSHSCGCISSMSCGFIKDPTITCPHAGITCPHCDAEVPSEDLCYSVCPSCFLELSDDPLSKQSVASPILGINLSLINPQQTAGKSKMASVMPGSPSASPPVSPIESKKPERLVRKVRRPMDKASSESSLSAHLYNGAPRRYLRSTVSAMEMITE